MITKRPRYAKDFPNLYLKTIRVIERSSTLNDKAVCLSGITNHARVHTLLDLFRQVVSHAPDIIA